MFSLDPQGQFESLKYISADNIVSSFVLILLTVSSILFLFNLLFGGIRWMLSGGEKERVDRAKRQLINALIGLVIVFSAFAIVDLINVFFGINLFLLEIPTISPII